MNLQIISDDFKLDEKLTKFIEERFTQKIDKLLMDFDEDMKIATMRIEKGSRWGFKVNFDLMLPGKKHVYSDETGKNLQTTILALRNEVMSQVKDYKEKLQNTRD